MTGNKRASFFLFPHVLGKSSFYFEVESHAIAAIRSQAVTAARDRVRSLLDARAEDGDGDILHVVGISECQHDRKRKKRTAKQNKDQKKQKQDAGGEYSVTMGQSDEENNL